MEDKGLELGRAQLLTARTHHAVLKATASALERSFAKR